MGKKKGIKFGAKKGNDLDAFIEAEFDKINKQKGPALGAGTGGYNDAGDNQVNLGGGNVPGSGASSNFDQTPQSTTKKLPQSSKPMLSFKPGQIKKAGVNPLQASNNNVGAAIEDSGRMDDQFLPSRQNQMPTSNVNQQPPIGMTKPNLTANKAVLPSQLKPKLISKQKFQMAPPDEKQSGMVNFKARMEDDVVESMDINNDRRPLKPQVKEVQLGPQKLKEHQKNLEDSKIERFRPESSQKQTKKQQDSDEDNYDNDFDDEGQEDEDQLTKIRKAMEAEKKKAEKYEQKIKSQGITVHGSTYNGPQVSAGPNLRAHSSLQAPQADPGQYTQSQSVAPQPQKNLESFAKAPKLIIGERVDHVAANQQMIRAEELRELVDLGQEEFFNMFEMVPQTPQDVYFAKLTAGTVKTAIVSCSDDLIDKDVQTEDLGEEDKFNQAPEDIMANYNKNKNIYQRKKKRENEALNLEKFMARAGPVVEQIIDENEQLQFLNNRDQAQKRNAVELKQSLKFPQELLALFGATKIEKISCLHMFESSPQSKCAIAYQLQVGAEESISIIIVFSVTANQILRIFRCEAEVTQMCTPADDTILLAGTTVGSINLFDLKDYQTSSYRLDELHYEALMKVLDQNNGDSGETNTEKRLRDLRSQFAVYHPTFSTDGLPNYIHFSPIRRLVFVTKFGGSAAQIGVIDELLTISTWSVIEIQPHIAEKMNDFDLNMSIGGRYKLLPNFSENLMYMPDIMGHHADILDIAQSLELEFDSTDPNIFYFSCSVGLFKLNRRESSVPTKMDTTGMSAPTALSISDKGYLLVGFSCGSIAMYHQNYTSPITVWYQACNYAITQIKWCLLYFQDDGAAKDADSVKFATRLCEFFAIDQSEDFLIWNLQKNIHKPAHVIHFNEKHASNPNNKLYRISMTCPDQSFFTAFALEDHSVNMYLMNFKKGSSITKEKLKLENKKSLKILTMLPMNLLGDDAPLL